MRKPASGVGVLSYRARPARRAAPGRGTGDGVTDVVDAADDRPGLGRFAELDLLGLSQMLASRTPAPADLASGEWLGVVQLLTMLLARGCAELAGDSWRRCSAALDHALESAVASGAIDHRETVIRRLNLSAALLQQVPADPNVDLLAPARIARLFLDEVPMAAGEARELAPRWHSLDISLIRRLRYAKSLAFPALLAMRSAGGNEFDERLKEWADVLPLLP